MSRSFGNERSGGSRKNQKEKEKRKIPRREREREKGYDRERFIATDITEVIEEKGERRGKERKRERKKERKGPFTQGMRSIFLWSFNFLFI